MTKVAELSVEELMVLLKTEMREVVHDAVRDVLLETHPLGQDQLGILDIPSLDVGVWPEGLKLLSREEMC